MPKKITLVLGNQIYLTKECLPPALKNRLIRLAAFQNPEFYKAQAMRFPTFDMPRVINCCEDFPKHIGIPRGRLDEIIDLLQSLGIAYDIIDPRYSGTPISVKFIGTLRQDQEDVVEYLLKYETGVFAAPTAFGKTVVACNLIAQRSVKTLIVVHRKQLLDQWILRLGMFLDLPPDHIGRIGGGKSKRSGIIDVAMIQSLSRKGVVDDAVGEYDHLIVDECHHVSARRRL